LNSEVNERRRRGFFPMLSMIGHPLGAEPLMVDVRQNGSGSSGLGYGIRFQYRLVTTSGRLRKW
jgi:hypothetical protein